MLLTHRKLLRSKAIAIENDLRGALRNFALKVGMGRKGEVRGPHPGACRDYSRLGDPGGTTARRAASAARTDHHPAPPLAGHRALIPSSDHPNSRSAKGSWAGRC